MKKGTIEDQLQVPFPPEDIEWRAQSSGIKNGNAWAMIMPFITNRAIQERLDEVFGVYGWDNQFKEIKQADGSLSFLCGISIYFTVGKKDDGFREFVTKWDGADETNFENFKGGLSNSMKRAGVQLGIGRYLYKLDTYFAELSSDRKGKKFSVNVKKDKQDKFGKRYFFNAPKLPALALPENFKYEASKKKVEDKATEVILDEHEKAIEDMGGKTFTQQCAEIETLDDLKKWYVEQLTLGLDDDDKKAMTACKDNRKEEIVKLHSDYINEASNNFSFDELKAMKLPELYEICKDEDLMGYTKKSKADVINLILKHINK